ncbi:MAG: hypothetical protein ACREAE_08410 [Nitrosopumilaceae archaeon]
MANEYTTAPVVLRNADYIDGTTAGSTHVVTTASGRGKFQVTTIFLETTDLTGLITLGIVSVGTNSPNFNNIKSGMVLAAGNPDQVKVISLNENVPDIDEVTAIYVKVTTPSLATEHLFKFGIQGSYVD